MFVIKSLLYLSIFALSSIIGITLSQKYKGRVIELTEFKTILNTLKTKIRYTYEPLKDIFEEITKSGTSNVGNVLLEAASHFDEKGTSMAWEEAIEQAKLNINAEDKAVLKSFGKLLRKNRCRRANK